MREYVAFEIWLERRYYFVMVGRHVRYEFSARGTEVEIIMFDCVFGVMMVCCSCN